MIKRFRFYLAKSLLIMVLVTSGGLLLFGQLLLKEAERKQVNSLVEQLHIKLVTEELDVRRLALIAGVSGIDSLTIRRQDRVWQQIGNIQVSPVYEIQKDDYLYLVTPRDSHPEFVWPLLLFVSLLLLVGSVVYGAVAHNWGSRYQRLGGLLRQLDEVELKDVSELPKFDEKLRIGRQLNRLIEKVVDARREGVRVDQKIRSQTFLDADTGIGNRAYFSNNLEAVLADSEIRRGVVMLLQVRDWEMLIGMLDKKVARQLVVSLVNAVKPCVEHYSGAVLARQSEQDLITLLPNVSSKEAEQIAQKIVKSCIRINLPKGLDSEQFFHIGVTQFVYGEDSYQVLAEADMALRAAQLQGPNTWFMYDSSEMGRETVKGSVRWRSFLECAISQDSFSIHFQPVIVDDDRTIHHHEVLARLKDENGELISASVFLPMASKNGMTAKIDQLILSKTIRTLKYDSDSLCSVNLNVESLLDKTFSSWLTLTLLKQPDIARQLILELPEYYVFSNCQQLESVLQGLKATGVKLAVDHVGQYVVGSDYIDMLQIDFIKLHSSIVHSIHERSDNQLFVRSLLTMMGTSRKVQVFAQGVELENEWQMLRQMGVIGGLGRLFNEPLANIY